MKISWKDASELYSFFTIGVILPASNCLTFRKKPFRSFIKMALTGELKVLDDIIKANQAQRNLDRKVA